ncbi:g9259 [Coccomyxa elongata]
MSAAPSTVAPETTQQLTKSDLVKYLASGCKPREKWRIGTEHEKLGYKITDNTRIDYAVIQQLLQGLCDRFGWKPVMEGEYIIGAELDGQSVSLEPGGQFELSGAPLETLHMTCAETNNHLYQTKTLAKELGIGFLGLGFDPKWRVEDVPIMPKNRYRIMREYMPKRGTLGRDMMFRSTTIQVNLDFEDEADMVEKMRIGMALQPVATALFANSPFRDGKDTGYISWRSHVWTDVDPDRTGILPFVWDDDFGFERYTEYALDVPMYFLYRNGKYEDATQQRCTFREYLEGRLPIAPGQYPSLKDWETHLTTIFPEVRLKRYMEMRGADGGPWDSICALPALWVGLLYTREIQTEAYEMIKGWTLEEHQHLRDSVPSTGLKTPFRDGTLQDVAKQVLALSRRGLQARGNGEESFLAPLEAIANSGITAGDALRKRFHEEWGGNVDHLFTEEFTY